MGVFPVTVEQATPRGVHKFFKWNPNYPVRNSVGKLGSGVDTRGDGGYVILAGSVRADHTTYQWRVSPDEAEFAEAPEWLYAEIRRLQIEKQEQSAAAFSKTFPLAIAETVSAEAAKVFNTQCQIVAHCEAGSRNDTLNKAAFAIGRFVAMGEISEAKAAEGLMWAAGACGLIDDDGEEAARKTIGSGFGAGKRKIAESNPEKFHENLGLTARPYRFPELSQIPRRKWLYGGHYRRKTVSATVAPSKVGKSSLGIVEALAMASGKPLLGVQPDGVFRVWIWNGEDDTQELELRVAACMKHYGLTREDLGDRLFLNSGIDDPIVIATAAKVGATIATPVVEAVIGEIRRNRIDVMLVDPFVTVHRVSENDNNAIDMVAKTWVRIAIATDCSIEVVHHTRKMNGEESTADDARGASAMVAASRSIRALSRMSDADARGLGLSSVAASLFRVTAMSGNMAPAAPSTRERWFRMTSVAAGNGEGDDLEAMMTGDQVGVVTLFNTGEEAKHMLEGTGLSEPDTEAEIRRRIAARPQRADTRASNWVGHAFAEALGLPIVGADDVAKANRETIKNAVRDWFNRKLIREITKPDTDYKDRVFVELTECTTIMENGFDLFG